MPTARKLASKPAPSKAAPTLTGQKLGKYTVGEQIGKGAFGDVYVAEAKDGTRVAVKVLDPQAARDDEMVARFQREAETARKLDHPHIVHVLDVGSSRGKHYIAMELVSGGSLRRLLDRGAPPEQVIAILAEVARALAHAHAQGIIHRDVKPENVLLTRSRRARVADFGLARTADQTAMTTDGRLLGTALYMSPEQARGAKATIASDVYAMGIILYEAISGRRPFDAEQPIGLLYQHAEVAPEPPQIRRPFPSSLGQLALACLAKDPAARPTMAQLAERLEATRLVRRRLWLPITLAAAAALVVLVIALPGVLSPLCGHWFGGGAFRSLRGGARTVHHAIFGGSEPAAKPPVQPPPHHVHRPGHG